MTDIVDPAAAGFALRAEGGDAAVLTHGFTGTAGHFRLLGTFLHRHGISVAAPLLAGHGTSMEDLRAVGREEWIDQVASAYRTAARDHDRVHLVGLSMGGLLSIVVASRVDPAGLVTINSPVRFRNRRIHLARFVHRFRPEVRWEGDGFEVDEEAAPLAMTYPGFPTAAAAELVSVSRMARDAAPLVRCPSLVIQSLVDESVDPRSARDLTALLGPHSRVMWLETSRHNALLDPERHAVHAAVLDHIHRCGRPTTDG